MILTRFIYVFIFCFFGLNIAFGCNGLPGCEGGRIKLKCTGNIDNAFTGGFIEYSEGVMKFGRHDSDSIVYIRYAPGGGPVIDQRKINKYVEIDRWGFELSTSVNSFTENQYVQIQLPCGLKAIEVNGVYVEVPSGESRPSFSFPSMAGSLSSATTDWKSLIFSAAYLSSNSETWIRARIRFFYEEDYHESDGIPSLSSFSTSWAIPPSEGNPGALVKWHVESLTNATNIYSTSISSLGASSELINFNGNRKQIRLAGNGLIDVIEGVDHLDISIYNEEDVDIKDGTGFYVTSNTPARKSLIHLEEDETVRYRKYEGGIAAGEWILSESSNPSTVALFDVDNGRKEFRIEGVKDTLI